MSASVLASRIRAMVRRNILSKVVTSRECLIAVLADVRSLLSVGAHVPVAAKSV